MKKSKLFTLGILCLVLFLAVDLKAQVYEYTIITTIESVVPGGLGRSRMITTTDKGKLDEVKMKNFFSLAGINFGNVRQNDVAIANKLTGLSNQGWELFNTATGVYSSVAGGATLGSTGTGIFITRYFFRKLKQ